LGPYPGSQVKFRLNGRGEVVLEKVECTFQRPDRFEMVRGKADVKWRTQDLMDLLRGEFTDLPEDVPELADRSPDD
jgi:hypothetical protein